jgi:adenylate cyclase
MQDASATIARQLAQDDQAKRIYKLLIYVSEGAWVGEIAPPSEAMMQRGLCQVLQQFPDYGKLRSHLHANVNTLSKPAEYSEVADIILETIAQVHGVSGDDPTTTFLRILPELTLPPENSIYTPIAAHLTPLPNQIRLKKLAFCVAQSVWEGDVAKLEAMSWLDLMTTLHQRYPQELELTQAFQQVVSRLSKPIEYSLLAETLINAIRPLYEIAPAETPAAFIPGSLEVAQDQSEQVSEADIEFPLAYQTLEIVPPAPWSEGKGAVLVEAIDSVIFDLHYDIMKQSNPLRLKHLLLILVNSLEPEDAIDGMDLRQQTTIPLLSTAFRIHRKPEILAIKLREIARKLPDPEEYEGTIDGILRAFKLRTVAKVTETATAPKRLPLVESPVVTGIR